MLLTLVGTHQGRVRIFACERMQVVLSVYQYVGVVTLVCEEQSQTGGGTQSVVVGELC